VSRERRWLTAAEAADRLGVSEATALSDAKSGRLRASDRGVGRRPRWLISPEHVQEIIDEGGRTDRRSQALEAAHTTEDNGLVAALQSELQRASQHIANLEAEVSRLRLVVRNANVAVQAQTESLQQFVLEH
jgi:hypothetical protein